MRDLELLQIILLSFPLVPNLIDYRRIRYGLYSKIYYHAIQFLIQDQVIKIEKPD